MSTVIIGSGLSGLLTAINIKISSPDEYVLVLDPNMGLSNTMIAGQRIRAGIAGKRSNPHEEVLNLLKMRNKGDITEPMKIFTKVLLEELELWHSLGTPFTDNKLWFGPQWGDSKLKGIAKSKSVLEYFLSLAKSKGVNFAKFKIAKLNIDGNKIISVLAKSTNESWHIGADNFILAGGSATGVLFESTNREFDTSPQLLASENKIPTYDSHLTMIHPFGKCGKSNKPVAGCYETDMLSDVKIVSHTSEKLEWIEDLLKNHKAHYHFPEISTAIWLNGGVLELKNSQGELFKSCVSIHYNHLGVKTDDGVTVSGLDNLYAVGDAAGVGYFTNHNVRFPGFALGNCIVTAKIASTKISSKEIANKNIKMKKLENHSSNSIPRYKKDIKSINSKYVCELNLSKKTDVRLINKWITDLENIRDRSDISINDISIINLSKRMAIEHKKNITCLI